jgi:putative membrane protein
VTAIRMALSELRRLTAGRLPKLAVVALLLVPVLYGGLYLYANHDPYGRLDKIPTAVVVEDTGTTLATGEKLNVGPQVADELVTSKSFDWHRVDRADATAGVSDGKYEFALVLPASFSADLASSAEFTP